MTIEQLAAQLGITPEPEPATDVAEFLERWRLVSELELFERIADGATVEGWKPLMYDGPLFGDDALDYLLESEGGE